MRNKTTINEEILSVEKLELLKKRLEGIAALETNYFPVTAGQQSLWLLNCKDPETAAYNVAFSARICGAFDIPAMKRAWQLIINRHAALRTSFELIEEQLMQKVHGYQPVDFSIVEASNFSEDDFHHLIRQCYQQPFDLEKGPVCRVQLFTRNLNEYVLLFTAHHIAVDGASLWIILKELKEIYLAESANGRNNLGSPAFQYHDFANYQNQLLISEQGATLQQYWLNQLDGNLPALNIITDKQGPLTKTYNGASFDFEIEADDIRLLKELARKEHTTLFAIFMAALQTLLYRYTNQEDILIGTPLLGRNKEEYQNIVGYFSNPVVIRGTPFADLSFQKFLAQIRQSVIEAIVNQDYPFSILENQLQYTRDPARTPVFQCWFSYLKPTGDATIQDLFFRPGNNKRSYWGDLPLEPYYLPQQEGQFELSLFVLEGAEKISFTFKYNTDLFELETIRRLSHHFSNLLKGIIADPTMSLADLPIMDKSELDNILVNWNNTFGTLPSETSIHQLFERQAERTPGNIAIIAGQQSVTYEELNKEVNQLAGYLIHKGIKKGDRIGLFMDRSIKMIAALLGIYKSGGVYVPLDLQNPSERIRRMAEEVKLSFILSTDALKKNLENIPSEIICLDFYKNELQNENPQNIDTPLEQEQVSHIFFTSGSTGIPKAVMCHQKGVINFFQYLSTSYDVGPSDVVLQLASHSFDASFRDMIFPLTVGASVVIVSDWEHKDTRILVQKIAEHNVTCLLSIVPSQLSALMNEGALQEYDISSIRLILASGEPLPYKLCEKIKTLLGKKVCLVNQYGPTECTMISTFYITGDAGNRNVPAGKPIRNAKIYILNGLKPVPVGVSGEIFIGGAGVTYGYLDQTKLTNEKFIPDIFSNDPEEKLYRTGDLGYFLPNGDIVFTGRKDQQIKINGIRVELEEVEKIISDHHHVHEAAVVSKKNNQGTVYLAAYYIPVQQQSISANELREYMQKRLPAYMIPSVFISLQAFPYNKNGKLDREKLTNNTDDTTDHIHEFAAPRNSAEEVIAEIFSTFTTGNPVGIYDHFFHLGGNSLNAIQVFSRIREIFKITLPVKALFENPTVAGVVAELIKNEPFEGAVQTIADYYQKINQMSDAEIESSLISKRVP